VSLIDSERTRATSTFGCVADAAANSPDGTRSPRILTVCARYLPLTGGVETHVFETSRRIADAGCRVRILTTDTTGSLPIHERIEGMSVVRVPAWPRSSDIRFAPAIHRAIAGANCDLVHIQGYNTLVAPVAMMAAIRGGKPYVLSFHSGGHSSRLRNALRGAQYQALRPLVGRAAQLIGCSQFEADFFSREMAIERDRFEVVPNGGGLPRPSRPPALLTQHPLILSVGRLERYKGHQKAIEAMPLVLQRKPGARLRIAGTGPYENELRALAARLGVDRAVVIEGVPPQDRTAMANLLASAALVVLFSDYEAHPVAVAEALTLGRRVLASDNSGFRELIERGCISGAPNAAPAETRARLILEALDDRPGSIPVSLPTWDDCADRLLAIYRRVLAGARRA
jgi:glycosyltransferase involved in cell wall biosynthesis